MRLIFSLLALLMVAMALTWSVMLARADASSREGTPAGIERAIEQMPGNTEYLALAALQAEDPGPFLERIVERTPRVSAPRIRLGLAAEQRGDIVAAERSLRDAYAVDHQFETRWTLANFYLRQGKANEFWPWMRSALEVSYGDRHAAFDLCWNMSTDAKQILASAIPNRQDVAADYLLYLIEHGHAEALADAAKKVHDPDLLLSATDVLLDTSRYGEAVDVWRLAGRSGPDGVTGPNFEAPQTGHGFDWRRIRSVGVRHPFPGRIQLSGEQGESVELLRQLVGGLHPGTAYQLEWKFSTEVPGLEWRIGGQPLTMFVANAEFAVLSLQYQRPLGEVRAEATFDLSGVKLSALH